MYYLLLIFSILFPFIYNPAYHNNSIYRIVSLNGFVLLMWLIIMIQIIRGKNPFKEKKLAKIELSILIYALLITLSTLLSIDRDKSLFGEYGRYEGFTALISYCSIFIFTYRFVPKEKIIHFIKGFTIVAAIMSIYGILQHFKLDPFPRSFMTLNWRRSWSTFGNPNFFGSYLTLMLPFAMILFYKGKDKLTQILTLTASGIIFLALLYSQTRSGWLGSCIGYLILSIILLKQNKQFIKRWAILSLTFLVIFIGVNVTSRQAMTNRIDETITQVTGGNIERGGSGRIFIWMKTIPLIDDYFLYGSGPDTLIDAYPNTEENLKQMGNKYVDKAHNEYLQIAVTLGTPALIVYLLILGQLLYQTIKQHKQITKPNQLTYALLVSFIGYIIQAFFNISVVSVAPYFWMVMGLLYKIIQNEKNDYII